jgi:trimeric autotransporter adhesin
MRILKPIILTIFGLFASIGLAQIPQPPINLSNAIGCQGFPCLNSGTLQFTSDANHTLTTQESSATGGIKLTSTVSLTATRSLILPTSFGKLQFLAIENATTGGQSITVIGQSGTGVTIANGSTATVWYDGTNVVQSGSSGGSSVSITSPSSSLTLSPSPLTGTGTVDLNLAHANNWTGVQTFTNGFVVPSGGVGTFNSGGFINANEINGAVSIFSTNGTPNSSQAGVNFVAGAGVALVNTGNAVQINAGGAVLQTTNLIGYYTPFKLGGTTIPDNSGNGNTLTFCPCSGVATAPTSDNTGLNFPITAAFPSNGANVSSAAVIEPTGLSAATNSVVMSVYITPQGTGVGTNNGVGSGLMLSADNTAHFYSSVAWGLNGQGGGSTQTYSPFVFGGASPLQYQISGYHILGWDFGVFNGSICTSNDVLYIDGQPMTGTYTGTGCSGSVLTGSNHFYIGPSSLWTGIGFSFPGKLFSLAQYSAPLGASGQQQVAQAILAENYSRGVPIQPIPALNSAATLFTCCDSITYGLGVTTPYSGLLTLTNPPTTQTLIEAVSGTTLAAVIGSEPNRIVPQCYSPAGQCIVSLFGGTNDFLSYTADTATSVFSKLTQEATLVRNAGAKVGALTMLSRSNTNPPGATACAGVFDTCKDAYNPLIVNSGLAAGLTFIVDVANFPGFGADGAYANPTSPCNATHTVTPIIGGSSTCFQSDGVHPTQAGQQAIADMYSNVYNHVFGNTPLNPHILASSGTTYQMIPSDGGVTVTGSTAQTMTLPDCSGQTGLHYFILNRSSASITLNRLVTAQAINGASSITIGAGTSADIFAQANSYVTSGCQWTF